jgi:conjugal transfer mating pair stabilization protein TraG
MNQDKQYSVIPSSYRPLLNLIADVESRGNYNAYFGNTTNSSIDFTKMSIAEVRQWQKEQVEQGSPSSAVGRYQIIDTTLAELVRTMNINQEQLFDQATQDKMAIALIEKRGSLDYVNGEITRDQFAANLAKEWASLPSVIGNNPNESYYQGDGLNKSLINKEKVFGAINLIEAME